MSTAVGFVGIGTMGWPMSANLASAGFAVSVFDIDCDRTERWAREHTGTVAHDLGAVASSCDVIVTMLPTGAEVRQAVDAMGGALRPGTVVVDKPLRSGQKIYARGADLVVLAMVNQGAEVVADGNIHVYAPLRGKAMASSQWVVPPSTIATMPSLINCAAACASRRFLSSCTVRRMATG